jgi:hypothetical protein
MGSAHGTRDDAPGGLNYTPVSYAHCGYPLWTEDP